MINFKTKNGNFYAWDDNIGLFVALTEITKSVFELIDQDSRISKEDVINLLNNDFDSEEIEFSYDWIKKWRSINPPIQINQNIVTNDIKQDILRNGLTNLILGVTEDCNLRCKYCAYSEHYEHSRNHLKQHMTFKIAKKAIDYYYSLIEEGEKYNPYRNPCIGFYGGEPLLNFDLIQNCVNYIKKTFDSAKYTITTNGTLLDFEKANFLMKNDFIIYLSLDGPQNEHDRNRVYENGNGTHKDIMQNIEYIINSGYENIYSIPVFDWKTNIFNNESFFTKKGVPTLISVNAVNETEDSDYYKKFEDNDFDNFIIQLEKAKEIYFNEYSFDTRKKSYFYYLFNESLEDEIFGFDCMPNRSGIMPYTGSCVPGKKIFVDVNGNFYACERVNKNFSIGNAEEGLNYKTIQRILNIFSEHMDKCSECNVKCKCKYCFQNFESIDGYYNSSKICESEESNMQKIFVDTFSIAEKYTKIVEENFENKNLKKFYGD